MKKLPGKTRFSGRRRTATRKAGFESHPDATGGEHRSVSTDIINLPSGSSVRVRFTYRKAHAKKWVGFGGWFSASGQIEASVKATGGPRPTRVSVASEPAWSKFGSMWISDGRPFEATLTVRAHRQADATLAFWDLGCGTIHHPHLTSARPELLRNMPQFSPEAHFFDDEGQITLSYHRGATLADSTKATLHLKSCNRCARFLPINVSNERHHLSFTNHCVAEHRRPCRHGGFGILRDVNTGERIHLEYGFQLECRFCKKFEVNSPLNPQRTSAQMKEDAARRREFELLLMELYDESPQLLYRHRTGQELADTVFEKFGRRCFKCSRVLKTSGEMHLDHTRPLALLWPLDDTATALCGNCNSAKRDRPPVEFYSAAQLVELSQLTNLPLETLRDPAPNLAAVRALKNRLDWFFREFLIKPELVRERDGKTVAELVVKALQKVIDRIPPSEKFDLVLEFERRRSTGI